MMKQYARLRKLASGTSSVKDTLVKMAKILGKAKERGIVQLQVIGDKDKSWCVELNEKGVTVQPRIEIKPTLEIITRLQTWNEIAGSSISPIEAFLTGKLRVRGDEELAKRLLKHLAGTRGKTEC